MKILKLMTFAAFSAALFISCTKEISESGLEPQSYVPATLKAKLVGNEAGEIVPGSLLVELDENATALISKGSTDIITELLEKTGAETLRPAMMIQPKNIAVAKKYGLHRWYCLNFDENMSVKEVATKAAEQASVKSVQFNTLVEPIRSDKVAEFEMPVQTRAGENTLDLPFDDPYLGVQWNLINTGDKTVVSNAVAGADVGVKDAWRLTAGDPSVVVAVFDCAVNNMHTDLKDAIWVNEAEKNGVSGVDDDGNGYIDDKYGFNFVQCQQISSSKIEDFWNEGSWDGTRMSQLKSSDLDWTGGTGHGTHVAGIIGAVNGNGKGVSSIAGGTGNNDGVRLMSCQIFQGSRSASDAQNAAAYIYAADNGACIAQCSYGTSMVITSDDQYINGDEEIDLKGSPLENRALLYFLDPANSNHPSLEGNIAVFAAGNHKNPYSSYPGALPYVLSVTAFGADFLPGGYTNYGPGCKIAAPGGEYTDQNNYNTMILSTGVSNAAQPSPGMDSGRNYQFMQGTSMACPHVSGVISLGIAYAKKLGKRFTRDEFTSMLLTSTNDIDQYLKGTKRYYDLSGGGWTDLQLNKYQNKLGTGAVDAWKFLMAIEGTPTALVKANQECSIDLDDYLGEGVAKRFDITIDVDNATKTALGLTTNPVVRNGKLVIRCTKIGSGKITLSSSVGKDPEMSNGIGGHGFSKEISITSRLFATENGGWL